MNNEEARSLDLPKNGYRLLPIAVYQGVADCLTGLSTTTYCMEIVTYHDFIDIESFSAGQIFSSL
jgi:hypothetical protein